MIFLFCLLAIVLLPTLAESIPAPTIKAQRLQQPAITIPPTGAFTRPVTTTLQTPPPIPIPAATPTPVPVTMFPFALPPFDDTQTATDVSWLNPEPAGASGFVRVNGEHFVNGQGKMLRFWGVNLNFYGAFPNKDEATKVAGRLSKFGFNAVRMHHFEGNAAPNGLWKPVATGSTRVKVPREVDPEQMDRFDFFISELIRRGIYINLNMHVGRKIYDGEGVENAGILPEKDKGVNYYDERLIKLHQDFIRMLLTHVNPYTKRAYKDEPGICAIEVNNENALLQFFLDGTLSNVPRVHAQPLQDRWNAWLKAKYNDESLKKAWTEADDPLDITNMMSYPLPVDVLNPDAPDARGTVALNSLRRFELATVTGAQGRVEADAISGPTVDDFIRPGLTAYLTTPGTVSWSFQVNRDGLDLAEGRVYTLSFWARSDTPRRISVNLWQDREPRRFQGFTGYADLTVNWEKYSFVFRAIGPDPQHSRLSWNFGNTVGTVQMGEIDLRAGGRIAIPEEWRLQNGVPLIDIKTTPVLAAKRDFAEFLGQIEKDYTTRMRELLKKELGVRCPIWQTQAQFGGWGGVWRELASDAIDLHAYWKHPDLGASGWGGNTWRVENASMTGAPGTDPLSGFNMFRVAGKPFVMTEWNSGQPNDYGSESLLMVAAYAAWQDWASVYLFDYHSSGDYNRDRYEGFFSIDSQPVKMASAPAAALLYRRPGEENMLGDVSPAEESVTLTLPPSTLWSEVAGSPGGPHAGHATKTWTAAGASRTEPVTAKTYVRFEETLFPTTSRAMQDGGADFVSDTRQIVWSRSKSLFTVNTPKSKVATGFLGGRDIALDEWRIIMPTTQTNFATFTLSSMDGGDVPQSRRLLLMAAGRAENIGMGWNAERNSVGTQWGTGPTQVEGITAEMQITTSLSRPRVWALDTTGARRTEVPATYRDGVVRFMVTPQWQTVWYEIGAD